MTPGAAVADLQRGVDYIDENRLKSSEFLDQSVWMGRAVVWGVLATPVWLWVLLLLRTLDTETFLQLGYSPVVTS